MSEKPTTSKNVSLFRYFSNSFSFQEQIGRRKVKLELNDNLMTFSHEPNFLKNMIIMIIYIFFFFKVFQFIRCMIFFNSIKVFFVIFACSSWLQNGRPEPYICLIILWAANVVVFRDLGFAFCYSIVHHCSIFHKYISKGWISCLKQKFKIFFIIVNIGCKPF